MPGAAAYVVAVFAMLFAAASALTLFYAIDHLDAPPAPAPPEHVIEKIAV